MFLSVRLSSEQDGQRPGHVTDECWSQALGLVASPPPLQPPFFLSVAFTLSLRIACCHRLQRWSLVPTLLSVFHFVRSVHGSVLALIASE